MPLDPDLHAHPVSIGQLSVTEEEEAFVML